MKKSLLLAPALILMAGCETVSWLQPLCTPEQFVSEDSLPGVWKDRDGETVTIEAQQDRYRVTLENRKGEKTIFNANFFRIDGELYADLTEAGAGIPDHLPVRIELEPDRMTWYTLSDKWLRESAGNGTLPSIRLAEGRKDTRIVVNADPETAQRVLRSYRWLAWEEAVRLTRQQ